MRDAGARVANSVARRRRRRCIEGAALTVLVVFLFLNSWRSTVITGLALPVSVLASFVAVWAFGFTLNTMSLLGLSLAIGILIDDAIVVRENIVRHVEMGKDHYTAALEGTDEIGLAVAATTFSIVVVFVPIAFMGGIAGQWFKPFALTIACSVLVSLFVSFSLDPMLSAYWPDPHMPMEQRLVLSRMLGRFNDWFDRQAERYKRGDRLGARPPLRDGRCWRSRRSSARWRCRRSGMVGGGFLPETDDSEFLINIETPPGSNLDYTQAEGRGSGARWRGRMPEVLYTYTTIGGRTGVGRRGHRLREAARRRPSAQRQQPEIEAELRAELVRLGGVTASIGSGNFENQKQIQLQLSGPDSARAEPAGGAACRPRCEQVPGAVDVGLSTRGQKPELDVQLDRGLAGIARRHASARWRRRCGRRSPASTSATGSIRRARRATSTVRLAPESRTSVARPGVAAAVRAGPGRPRRRGAARPGGARSRRRSARRASITSIASA